MSSRAQDKDGDKDTHTEGVYECVGRGYPALPPAEEIVPQWDREKDWMEGIHLGVNLNWTKHWKYRTAQSQEHLEDDPETGETPTQQKERCYHRTDYINPDVRMRTLFGTHAGDGNVLAECSRWITGAYRGGQPEENSRNHRNTGSRPNHA